MPRHVIRIIQGTLLATILVYGLYGSYDISTGPKFSRFYTLLGKAFLSGHTYLLERPPDKLLASPDPYDREAHLHIGSIWDASLYHGKYYIYFGPIPALMPWMPAKWLTGLMLGDRWLTLIFCGAGTCWLVWLLMKVADCINPASAWGIFFAAISLCFGTWLPLILRQPGVYQAAISGAYCYSAIGLLFLWNAYTAPSSRSFLWKLLGSLSLGLAVGCRVVHIFNALVLFACWLSMSRRRTIRDNAFEAVLLGLPWSLCIAGLAMYNDVRFGSIFETGWHYQLSSANQLKIPNPCSLSALSKHLFDYWFKPLPWPTLIPWSARFGKAVHPEVPYGLWTNSPFALWSLALIGRIFTPRQPLKHEQWGVIIGFTLYGVTTSLFVASFRWEIARYMVDSSPWIMLAGAVSYLLMLGQAEGGARAVFLTLGGLTAAWGVYTGLAACFPFHA